MHINLKALFFLSQAGFDVHGVREMGDLYLWVIAVKPV